jgi:hypothetical protein
LLERRQIRLYILAAAVAASLICTSSAAAYSDFYGGWVCSGCYAESSGAHTFNDNYGDSIGSATYLACQLFNHVGTANVVTHAYQHCRVRYFGGAYVWARVYVQSAFGDNVGGSAFT